MANEQNWAGISEFQAYLFNMGDNFKSYEMLGVHKLEEQGKKGWRFSVWAPNAKAVRVVGEFNGWSGHDKKLEPIGSTGIWYGFFTDIKEGWLYKYAIDGADGKEYIKTDPYAVECELRPGTASVVRENKKYRWSDKRWLNRRAKVNNFESPMNIYEVHAGSWKIHEDGSFYNYRELADELIPYVKDMGYTHIELMPLTEFPYDGSWGYQVTGYFAATSRYGSSEDLKYFINKCHSEGIAVFMDWVPAHFPRDAHGLRMFDGAPEYEYADPRMGEHKDWGTMVFDYSKGEVISFLMSSAYFWASEYHIDGLRVDAVSSMLYRDYSRNDGEWVANKYGGNGNLEAVDFFRKLNKTMNMEFPGLMMIAEESTAWPKVTAPSEYDGLGFNFKWNMGWMNDTLRYASMDPFFRSGNHNLLTFVMMYAYSENYILPLSHDEVVHGKRSLIDKMYGTYEEKFDAYRTLLGYYMTIPGKKLMFMGGEIGQFLEWRFDDQLEWNILENDRHKKLAAYVKDLNRFYLENEAMWIYDARSEGFEWINGNDNENSVYSYIRKGRTPEEDIVVIANFTPMDRPVYRIGVNLKGAYEVVLHSNSSKYGGSRRIGKKTYKSKNTPYDGMEQSIEVYLDANSVMYLKRKKETKK
ncbi:MAG: 1,4-alpha-glucan branching protein GlgB [Clostridiales bacterium]|nr:1,4-alpha-glucan branching protein GlgB [Clostridiales bacterium]